MKITKHTFLTAILGMLCYSIFAQNPNLPAQHDYIWMTGYDDFSPDNNFPFGDTKIDFNIFPPTLSIDKREMDFSHTLGIMCDEEGELLFYTNGDYIVNNQGQTVDFSQGLNGGEWFTQTQLRQGILILPAPEKPNHFYLFHEPRDENGGVSSLLYSRLDMNQHQGLGGIVERRKLLLNDSLDIGKLTATRHANGRDWWILVPEYFNEFFYTILLDDRGIASVDTQYIDISVFKTHGVGQAVFSPDGSKYVRSTSEFFEDGSFFEIFDFDRCTGKLSNQQVISYVPTTTLGTPVAFSPNSRYLYITESETFYQFDTWADDIGESEKILGQWDGFAYLDVFPTLPWMAQLGPDGKIYIATTSTNPYWHVIQDPDNGDQPRFEERAILLPTLNDGTIANHPNYRLGPIDGSACDTLGLDNLPVANFRHENFVDTFHYRDLSVGAPTEWLWNFGDGNISAEQHNNHIYDSSGAYQVCLTVSNVNGSDTWCDTVSITLSNTNELEFASVKSFIYPNPTDGQTWLNLQERLNKPASILIYDALGKVVLQQDLSKGQKVFPLDLDSFSSGMYFYSLEMDGVKIGDGKLVKR